VKNYRDKAAIYVKLHKFADKLQCSKTRVESQAVRSDSGKRSLFLKRPFTGAINSLFYGSITMEKAI
jgi:hypothetical protein